MFIRKLETVDAFVAVDLADVSGTGTARLAPKILQGGARDMARSITYALASLQRHETGISAGINSKPESRSDAAAAFATEVADWDATFSLSPGKGVEAGELGRIEAPPNDHVLAVGAVAAATATMPAATTAAVIGGSDDLRSELASANITVIADDDPISAHVDLLFCGSKMGAIDHLVAARLDCSVVVPTGPLPLTARAVAVCRQRGILALPDFVTTCGPLIEDSSLVADTVSAIIGEVLEHPDGPLLGACERAEEFLATWQENLPFGRPMAP
ncbi:MAG: hypothetical protein H8E69_03235 [Actinobacteria bacterium]|nr:hypothetical protein [Actinomycetota bacterium]